MNTLFKSVVLFCAIVLFSNCSKDKTEELTENLECDAVISFSEDVLPLISVNCSTSGCHGGGSGAAGYVLTNYDNINQHKTIILQTMQHVSGVTPMPLGQSKLPNESINIVACWIEQGAPNN